MTSKMFTLSFSHLADAFVQSDLHFDIWTEKASDQATNSAVIGRIPNAGQLDS